MSAETVPQTSAETRAAARQMASQLRALERLMLLVETAVSMASSQGLYLSPAQCVPLAVAAYEAGVPA